jgi:pSer/pThr/pTyr-binding forkhead associated (FHA) protein
MWKLVIRDDEGRQTVVPLKFDEYVLGRKAGSRIRLQERNVSREHAKLRKEGEGDDLKFTVEDLSSNNGTYVNGSPVSGARKLSHGDLIQIGDYRMVLQDDTQGEVVIKPKQEPDEPEYDPD